MKICFVHEEYPEETNFGGIATYQKIMAEYFANHGDKVTVITRGNSDCEYYENKVHIYRISSLNDTNNLKSVQQFRRRIALVLRELQEKNEIDIIETPDWGANTIYFEKWRKVPLVVRLHTPLKVWLKYNNNDFGETKNLILKWENAMLKNADAITSCSNLLKEMVLQDYKINKDIIVLPNPYNSRDFYVSQPQKNKNIIYVGSLEERKGVIILAKSLNKALPKLPSNILIYFVGKDTKRNSNNISTKEYMLSLIDKKYHSRLVFTGQVENKVINKYLNQAYCAIFPSLFDNYPYTILEAMAAGKHIICSDNIGSNDLVKNNNLMFKSGNEEDLYEKIIELYQSKKAMLNYSNINIVENECNQDTICLKARKIYKNTIDEYNHKKEEEMEASEAFQKVICTEKIIEVKKTPKNLANVIFFVTTEKDKYIVKKYNYEYNFELGKILCKIYNKNKIQGLIPTNENLISVNGNKYNVFKYIKHTCKKCSDDFLLKLIKVKRDTNQDANILDKCMTYYMFLKGLVRRKKDTKNDELFAIKEYEQLKDLSLLQDRYINHGDLSISNILYKNDEPYIIDFDEAVVTTELYDFAVMVIKQKINNINHLKRLIRSLNYDNKYQESDYYNVIKFYLCKILLEKFYLYELGKIDLFDENQQRDDYRKYVKYLKSKKK